MEIKIREKDIHALCLGCSWTRAWDSKTRQSEYEDECRKHASKTGHEVHLVITKTITYKGKN